LTTSETARNGGGAPRPGDELELEFTDVLANGQGVGRADEMVVFCFGPLPGERARVTITTVKPRYAVGELRQLLRETPERARPFCPVFGACGGCQLQHLAYPAQLAWKRDVVRNALARIGGLHDVRVEETIGMDEPRAYRNKMALVVRRGAAAPELGFYRQRSHDVVPIDACPILTPALDRIVSRLTALRTQPPFAAFLAGARHLVARASRATDRAVLTMTSDAPLPGGSELGPALARELPGAAGVANSYELASANAILGRRQSLLAGESEIEEAIAGVRYRISAASFFQVNAAMLARIFDYMTPWLAEPARAVDLYCGAGTFSLFFAKHGWRVYGVEENRHAVAEAVANAKLNGLEGAVRFDAGRVERLVAAPRTARALREAVAVFLDPPRKGCDVAVLDAIANAGLRNVWYLSCDAATLARDLKFLVSKGYRLDCVQPFDMFPQTGHVETLVRLRT
jgi:23S rRNA (uracil1939-C5)-methyltransferase